MLHLIDLETPSNSTHFEIELLELKNDSYWKILFLIWFAPEYDPVARVQVPVGVYYVLM